LKRVLVLAFLLCSAFAKAQLPLSETYNCDFYKEIVTPLGYSEKPGDLKPMLNQTVFYSYRDQFTYWYKVVAKENADVHFRISPLNDSDSYSVFVYQYNGADFCKRVYHQTAKPVKTDFFSNANTIHDPHDLSEKKFKALKGNIYYISVLNTSINNCGHKLWFFDGKDTLRVRAMHIPCKRDLSELSIKVPVKKNDSLAIKPPVKKEQPPAPAGTPALLLILKNKKTSALIEYKPTVTDQLTQEDITLGLIRKGEWAAAAKGGSVYKVRCTPIGYKAVTTEVLAQSNDTTKAIISLEPLKEGEAFVMKSIYFYPNTYALKKESAPELQRLLSYLQNNENVTIEIQGHTNGDHHIAKNKAYESLGEEWNFKGSAKDLSQRRAQVIKEYLQNNGIAATRLVPKGYGGKKPIVLDPQNNEEGQMNIRVEIMILKT
jgi:outer membrane protein OmpA-like peptidoglycan-associated protein